MKTKTTMLTMILMAVTLTCQPLALGRKANDTLLNHGLAPLPDLVITNVTMGDPTTGDFDVVVQNKGRGKAVSCQLRLWIKDQKGKTVANVNASQPALQPGQSIPIKVSAKKGLGAYLEYTVTTDATMKVTEVSDDNNTWKGNTGKV